jgi:hypothetical protein
MTSKSYDNVISSLLKNTKEVADNTMEEAITEIKDQSALDDKEEDISNIGISVDGAWTKRGFSSHNCVVTAISLDNGKVVDVEPMARSCKVCNMKASLEMSDPVAYTEVRHRGWSKLVPRLYLVDRFKNIVFVTLIFWGMVTPRVSVR